MGVIGRESGRLGEAADGYQHRLLEGEEARGIYRDEMGFSSVGTGRRINE